MNEEKKKGQCVHRLWKAKRDLGYFPCELDDTECSNEREQGCENYEELE